MNIVLTGFMASGKSTVGKRLSEILNRPFVDTDALIEEKTGMKIAEIFDKYGENHFRELEKETVREASGKDGIVIATGGGVVIADENRSNLRKNGDIINLCPEIGVIHTRLKNDLTRPLARSKEIDEISARFEARKKYYDDCDFQIKITQDTDVETICNEILEFLGDRI